MVTYFACIFKIHRDSLNCRSGDLEAHPREDFPEEGLETEREGVDGGGGAEDIQTEPLTEKQINEVSQAVETFGMELVSGVT